MTEDNFDWLCDDVCVSLFKIMVHTDLVLTLWLPFIFIITSGRTIVHQSVQMGRCQANEKPYYPH